MPDVRRTGVTVPTTGTTRTDGPAADAPATTGGTTAPTEARGEGWVADAPVRRGGAPAAPAAPAAPSAPVVTMPATAAFPNGAGGDFGPLNPTTTTFPISPKLAQLVKGTDALDLKVLNEQFNPVNTNSGSPLKGTVPYKDPQEMFQGKAILEERKIMGGVIKAAMGDAGLAAMAPVLGALKENTLLRTPAHEYAINGRGEPPGNRVIFYGGSHTKPSDVQETVSDVDKLAMQLGQDGFPIMKQMVHFNGPGQGGTMQSIVSDGVAGTTHGGGFSQGYVNGQLTSIYSDWPSNYGRLSDGNTEYNANLYAWNYAGGVKDAMPRDAQKAFKQNGDMWDALLGPTVPFASNDPDPRHTNYQYNPLEIHDRDSMKEFAADAKNLSWDELKKKHGAFYCAEGQYVVRNLGPQDFAQLTRAQFEKNADGSMTRIGTWVNTFNEAYPADMKMEDRRKHPEIGWKHLQEKGVITEQQFSQLKETGRIGTFLEWQDENPATKEHVEGWQKYNPIDKEGMVAQPMTVGTLAWSLLHRFLPRDGIAAQLASDVTEAYKTGTPEVKQGIQKLLGGNDPTTPAGKAALGQFTFAAANATLGQLLQTDDFKNKLFQQAGIDEITNDADKQKVKDTYNKFAEVLMTSKSQTELDTRLKAVDDEFRQLKVHRSKVDSNGRPNGEFIDTTMLYAAPPSFSAWAQTPLFSGGPQVLQYIATAMHAEQEKKPAAPN